MCVCLDMYTMNYAYLYFRVLRLKDMNMCVELHDGQWFEYIKHHQNNRVNTFFLKNCDHCHDEV
jgi:hypothetical protein